MFIEIVGCLKSLRIVLTTLIDFSLLMMNIEAFFLLLNCDYDGVTMLSHCLKKYIINLANLFKSLEDFRSLLSKMSLITEQKREMAIV